MDTERYVVPLSHDEVANMKGSMVEKMGRKENLDFYERVRLLCACYGYQVVLPGRPLLFMGQEYGQGREWNCYQSLDWHERDEPVRQGLCLWVSDLMGTYRFHRPLHMADDHPHTQQFPVGAKSFEWVENNATACVVACCRHFKGDRPVLGIWNFGRQYHHGYTIGVPYWGGWEVLLNSDDARYSGRSGGPGNSTMLWTQQHRSDCSDSLTFDLPAGSCILLLAPEKFAESKAIRPPGAMRNSSANDADIEYCVDLGF